jgi:hypothetical protein
MELDFRLINSSLFVVSERLNNIHERRKHICDFNFLVIVHCLDNIDHLFNWEHIGDLHLDQGLNDAVHDVSGLFAADNGFKEVLDTGLLNELVDDLGLILDDIFGDINLGVENVVSIRVEVFSTGFARRRAGTGLSK